MYTYPYNKEFTIYIEGKRSFSFYYSYNSDSILYDLLEALAFVSPYGLSICPCCKIQIREEYNYNYKYNNQYYDVDMNEKIKKIENKSLKVIINNQCNCIYRDYFKKSKKFAIDSQADLRKQLEDLKVINLTLMKDLDDYKANLDKTKLEKKI